jgi:hypothetical protein
MGRLNKGFLLDWRTLWEPNPRRRRKHNKSIFFWVVLTHREKIITNPFNHNNLRPIPCSRVDMVIFKKQIPYDTLQGNQNTKSLPPLVPMGRLNKGFLLDWRTLWEPNPRRRRKHNKSIFFWVILSHRGKIITNPFNHKNLRPIKSSINWRTQWEPNPKLKIPNPKSNSPHLPWITYLLPFIFLKQHFISKLWILQIIKWNYKRY